MTIEQLEKGIKLSGSINKLVNFIDSLIAIEGKPFVNDSKKRISIIFYGDNTSREIFLYETEVIDDIIKFALINTQSYLLKLNEEMKNL